MQAWSGKRNNFYNCIDVGWHLELFLSFKSDIELAFCQNNDLFIRHQKLHGKAKMWYLNNFLLKVPQKSLGSGPKIRVGRRNVNTYVALFSPGVHQRRLTHIGRIF